MNGLKLSRRQFLLASASLGAAAAGGLLFSSRSKAHTGTLLSAFEDARGDQYVGGLSLQDERVFGARVPMRAHGCAVHPTDPNRVLFFARRPGTQAFELDRATMRVRTVFTTQAGQHLAGHGAYSANGDLIFTPEHDYERARGVVVVRDARNFTVVGEIDTNGIDPHEVAWMPDRTFVAGRERRHHDASSLVPSQAEHSYDGSFAVRARCRAAANASSNGDCRIIC